MIEILVCDDDTMITSHLSQLIENYILMRSAPFNVKTFLSGESLITHLQNTEAKKRIILLDIEMAGMSGLDVAKYLRDVLKDYRSELIFVTATNGYERDLFQVRPSGFISKPVDKTVLFETLDRSYHILGESSDFFSYNQKGLNKSILIDDILYFESSGRKKIIVAQDHTDWFNATMSQLKKDIEIYPQFIQCHRSYIVNVKHLVGRDGSDLIMSNKQLISVKSDIIPKVEHAVFQFF